jgi:hypothetical protein
MIWRAAATSNPTPTRPAMKAGLELRPIAREP